MAIAAPGSPLHPIAVHSDLSGSWGCGAWSDTSWFQLPWDTHTRSTQIAVKELMPIIIAAGVWGRAWRGKSICCWCDNQAMVAALTMRSSRESHLMHMLQCLFFIKAHHHLHLSATYISTFDNHIAEDLCRNCVASFFSKVPHMDPRPTPSPPVLPSLLLKPQLDWVSHAWINQFKDISTWGSPNPRAAHIERPCRTSTYSARYMLL